MLSYNLDSRESAEKLIKLCEKYKNDMDIDVICGRQVIDGCSVLGVMSLLGRFVSIALNGNDQDKIKDFSEELENLK